MVQNIDIDGARTKHLNRLIGDKSGECHPSRAFSSSTPFEKKFCAWMKVSEQYLCEMLSLLSYSSIGDDTMDRDVVIKYFGF